jgi:ATP:ADP antiporter, AAA family
VLPVVSIAFVLAASDRGLNYSLQQVTKESLYVPLTDEQKYKAKVFIDVFVDRAAKALSSVALLGIIAWSGTSVQLCLLAALAALARGSSPPMCSGAPSRRRSCLAMPS